MKPICAVFVVCFLGMYVGTDINAQKPPIPPAKNVDNGEKNTHQDVVHPQSTVADGDSHHNKNDLPDLDLKKLSEQNSTPKTASSISIPAPPPSSTTNSSSSTPAPPAPTPAPPAPTPAPPAPTPAPPAPTPAPPATTPAPPSPTPAPPVYGIGSWNVTDDKGRVCILLKGDIEMKLFNETDKKLIQTYRVPQNAPSHGKCSEECIMFELPNNSSLHIMFAKNDSKFYIHTIEANLTYTTENHTHTFPFGNRSLHLFETSLDQSYFCAPPSENVVDQKPMMNLTLKVSNFQVQAYKNSSTPGFDSIQDCEASHTPDVVPIVVGCLLALLVVLVLVAYLISRRRSQSRGYISM